MKALCISCEEEFDIDTLTRSGVQRFCPGCGAAVFEIWD